MRFAAVLALSTFFLTSPAWAYRLNDRPPDSQELAKLEAKAAVATPRDQPWLYAELVHSMTDIATAQLQAGQYRQASASLRAAQRYAARIHGNLLRGARRLQNAEILIRHSAFRLGQLLSGASLRERPELQATLQQVNTVRSAMLNQVLLR